MSVEKIRRGDGGCRSRNVRRRVDVGCDCGYGCVGGLGFRRKDVSCVEKVWV